MNKSKNVPVVFSETGLTKPGDELSARITDSYRKVLKVKKNGEKYSFTQYPNGTVVETRTTKLK
jgi:hypothetical protein